MLRSNVMGTLAVPAVSRMVSERTDRPCSVRTEGGLEPGQGRLLLARRQQARLRRQEQVVGGLRRRVPRCARGHGAGEADLPGPRLAQAAGRHRRGGGGRDQVPGDRLVVRPHGTWAKSWSRVTGWINGLSWRSDSTVETKIGSGAHAAGATATTARTAGVPPGPRRFGHLVVDERGLGQQLDRGQRRRSRPWPRPAGPRGPRPTPWRWGPSPTRGEPGTGASVKGWVTVSGPVGPDTEPGGPPGARGPGPARPRRPGRAWSGPARCRWWRAPRSAAEASTSLAPVDLGRQLAGQAGPDERAGVDGHEGTRHGLAGRRGRQGGDLGRRCGRGPRRPGGRGWRDRAPGSEASAGTRPRPHPAALRASSSAAGPGAGTCPLGSATGGARPRGTTSANRRGSLVDDGSS